MVAKLKADQLIVGTGAAAQMCALYAHDFNPDLKILIATKALKGKGGCSHMVQGGFNVVLNPADSHEKHLMDTLKGGQYMMYNTALDLRSMIDVSEMIVLPAEQFCRLGGMADVSADAVWAAGLLHRGAAVLSQYRSAIFFGTRAAIGISRANTARFASMLQRITMLPLPAS